MQKVCTGPIMRIAFAAAIVLAVNLPADALPMFARRMDGASCTKCHWHQNALNATGRAFLKHGIREVGETADARESGFKASHYLSFMVTPGFSAVRDDRTAFSAGHAGLWLGGPVNANFSMLSEIEVDADEENMVEAEEFYAHYVTNSRSGTKTAPASAHGSGQGGPEDEEEEEEMADLLTSKYLSVRLGQFQPLVLLGHVSGAARISLNRPEAISGRATNGNGWRPRSRLRGIEVGSVNGPLSAYLGFGNGQGQNEDDNHMDIYTTVERDLGTKGSSVGAYAYWGEAVLSGGFRDSFNRYGVIGNYTAEMTRLVGGFLFGDNDDPSGVNLDNDGWFVELAQHVAGEGVVAYARWDDFSRDLAAGGKRETDGPTLGISWTPDPDNAVMRLNVEGQWLDTDGTSGDSVTVELQITF
ncbi:MAG: hypothetical protein HYX78_02750 [Armatimonadetes bacterium]|nr:hypothetical protein [Armatimonadota bacterium]